MKILYLLTASTFSVLLTASAVYALSPIEVENIAKATTVKIERKNGEGTIEGSGVIIKKQGNIYTIITNDHVINCSDCTYTIRTNDNRSYQIPIKDINSFKKKSDLDIASIRFNSNKKYMVAPIGDSNKLKIKDKVYTTGFPAKTQGFSFNAGVVKASSGKRLEGDRGGYTIIYNAFTTNGMSGSGVFNEQGQVVAVHGSGDRYVKGTYKDNDALVGSKVGFNRGIPIKWLSNLSQIVPAQSPSTADDFFILGFNRYVEPGKEESIVDSRKIALNFLNKAISLNPNYEAAYFSRAYVFSQLDYFKESLRDYNKYITLDPSYANAYNNRGLIKELNFNDYSGALADFNKAIKLNPNFAVFYLSRGILKHDKLGDFVGSLSDYNQAIKISPAFALPYFSRGNLKYFALKDFPGAMSDYNQAIELDKKFAKAYHNRGLLKNELKDKVGARKDLNLAAEFYKEANRLDGYEQVKRVLQSL
jgi:Flp pilus assembly protein TadD/V8-like Glu-specific endopeptidase